MSAITNFALLALSAVGAYAAPSLKRQADGCLDAATAQQVATNYGLLISNYSKALADAVLDVSFVDYSESVNSLINECPQGSAAISLPLLSPTFTSLAQFEGGQSQQPPINFQQLNVWSSCNEVFLRWTTNNTANITDVKPVIGLIVLETIPAPPSNEFPVLVKTVYSEFDAAAWLENLQEAGICATANATSSAAPTVTATATATTTVVSTVYPSCSATTEVISSQPLVTPTPLPESDADVTVTRYWTSTTTECDETTAEATAYATTTVWS